MSDSAFARSDPPFSADEAMMLRSFLDYFRATNLRLGEGLTADQLATSHPPATMTIGGIVKHLAWVEHYWWVQVLQDGSEASWVPAGAFADDPDWEWHSAAADPWDLLVSRFRESVARGDEALDAVLATPEGLDTLALRTRNGEAASVRWILVHLVEEHARHAGHADLIRECLDGATDL